MNYKEVIRCEKQIIKKLDSQFSYCKVLTRRAKSLYNFALYIINNAYKLPLIDNLTDEQYNFLTTIVENVEIYTNAHPDSNFVYDEDNRYIGYCVLDYIFHHGTEELLTKTNPFVRLPGVVADNVLKGLDKNFKSYFALLRMYNKGKSSLSGEPKPPKYLNKLGAKTVTFPVAPGAAKICNGKVYLQKKFLTGKCADFIEFNTNLPLDTDFKEVSIVPKGSCFELHISYKVRVPIIPESKPVERIMGIDLGVDNFATCVTTIEGMKPFIINGKGVKSFNRYFNKQKSFLKHRLDKCQNSKFLMGKREEILKETKEHYSVKDFKQFTSKRLLSLSTKRSQMLDVFMHEASSYIINFCLRNGVDTIVVGKNDGWKQSTSKSKSLGKVTRQHFAYLPYSKFLEKLKYKCEDVGIRFLETEESYTSKSSFFDKDILPRFSKNFKGSYSFVGNREGRSYKTANGTVINADVNGAYNIIRKEFKVYDGVNISNLGRLPIRINVMKFIA